MAQSPDLVKKPKAVAQRADDTLTNLGNHPAVRYVADMFFQQGKKQPAYTSSQLEGKEKKKPGESLKKKALTARDAY